MKTHSFILLITLWTINPLITSSQSSKLWREKIKNLPPFKKSFKIIIYSWGTFMLSHLQVKKKSFIIHDSFQIMHETAHSYYYFVVKFLYHTFICDIQKNAIHECIKWEACLWLEIGIGCHILAFGYVEDIHHVIKIKLYWHNKLSLKLHIKYMSYNPFVLKATKLRENDEKKIKMKLRLKKWGRKKAKEDDDYMFFSLYLLKISISTHSMSIYVDTNKTWNVRDSFLPTYKYHT